MKMHFTSKLLPMSNPLFCFIGRKRKKIFNARITIILLLVLTILIPAQNFINPNFPDAYKNVYIWKEKENFSPTDDSILTVLGRWAWGSCLAVDADSNFAYIGNGPTFHILKMSDPSSPTITGEFLTEGYIYDIEIRDNTAFACIGSGLLVLDISDPSAPEEISFVEIGGAAISFALEDSFAYVTTFGGTMWVVDISDLNNPYKRSVIAAGGELAYCVVAKDRQVYIGNPEWSPMVIVDATNPDSLTRVDFEVGGWGYSADIKDTLLFIGVHGYTGTNYFKIYNVSNASAPQLLGEAGFIPPEDVMAITVSDDMQTAYARTTTGNIYSIDITNLTQPEIVGEYEKQIGTIFGNTGIAFSNNSILSAHVVGLIALDATQPDSLILQSFFPTGGTALEMDSKDNLVFVACGLSGLWILNISNPIDPQPVSNLITGGFTADLVVEDTIVYMVNWAAYSEQDTLRGLWIIDISDIYRPKIISHYIGITNFSTHTESNSISKSDNLIFITQQPRAGVDSILEIIDVSDIYQPNRLGVFVSEYYPKSCSVKDSILFLSTYDSGLRIINISYPSQLQEVSVFRNNSSVYISEVIDTILFLDKVDTIFVLNVSNPIVPGVIGSLKKSITNTPANLEAIKDYLYLASGSVIDITNLTFPKELMSFNELNFAYDVEASGNIVLFSERANGIWAFKNNLISDVKNDIPVIYNFELYQNYPNPFNPTTKIEFNIPKRERVLIEIFNVLGQKIQTILDQEIEAGSHKIVFNSFGLSSGIYIYRMRTKDISITKKMVILR